MDLNFQLLFGSMIQDQLLLDVRLQNSLNYILRVVQTQAILFLKSMSGRVGSESSSDKERLWILNDKLYLYRLKVD